MTDRQTDTELKILKAVHQGPYLVNPHYTFQTKDRLHLVLGEYIRLYACMLCTITLWCMVFFELRILGGKET